MNKLETKPILDVHRIREDFPILSQRVHGRPLIYFDNAATSQKPRAVIEALDRYYTEYNANVHRGVHFLSQKATHAYEEAREEIARFMNAASSREIIYTSGTTEGINLVAQTYGRTNLKSGDEVLISTMEHHSNIVPWQILCEQTGATLKVIPISDSGELEIDEYAKLLGPRTEIVSIVHVSNSLGTINPVREIAGLAHKNGSVVVVDGAQAAPHMRIDVQDLDCDFYAISGHKMFGPTGIGALYGREEILATMPPFLGGGDMISSVTFEKTTYNDLPWKFEAGTPNIADAIGMGAAVDYLEATGIDAIATYEAELLAYGTELLESIPEVRLVGTAQHKASVLSFVVDGVHPHDVGTILDQEGIAVRTGQHCTQPVMDRYGIPATARASLAFYNTKEELDELAMGVRKVVRLFG